MKAFFLFFLFLSGGISLPAQKKVQNDTSKISLRSVNKTTIGKLKSEKDFQYENVAEPAISIWDKFWSWVWWRIGQIMNTKPGRVTVWTILSILAASVIVFFVMKVTGMNKAGLFSRKSDNGLPYNISDEDIHGISFDEAIEKAITEGNFRMAIRLLYLQSLKKLSDKNLIEWKINKTNSDYILEVLNKPWSALFKSLTLKFEYTWYGEVLIGKEEFESLHAQFKKFNNQLQ